jgi:hypothetical protein
MTQTENLEIIKAALTEKKDALNEACNVLDQEAKEERKAVFEKLFANELVSYADVTLATGYSGIYFKIGHKEIGSINERGYGSAAKEVYFNTYATTCDDEFEYRRLMFNGRIAERMLNDMESIKEAFETPFSKKEELEALSLEFHILSGEIKQKEYQMAEARKYDITTKLNGEGIEWEVGKLFEFNRQWSSYQVKKVRIVKATKSGKTVDLEVTYAQYDWDTDENDNTKRVEKEDRIATHEGIKMDYVMGNFRDAIYKY